MISVKANKMEESISIGHEMFAPDSECVKVKITSHNRTAEITISKDTARKIADRLIEITESE